MTLTPSVTVTPIPTPSLDLHPHLHLPKNWGKLGGVLVSGRSHGKVLYEFECLDFGSTQMLANSIYRPGCCCCGINHASTPGSKNLFIFTMVFSNEILDT